MTRTIIHSLLTSLLVIFLISCGGGGGSAGIGGTGITSGGTITGFGSIFVNGIEYDTDSATVSGDRMDVSDLKLGMVVTVRGQLNSGTATGKADTIVVDIELKGAISTAPVLDANNGSRSFTVLGRKVIVSDTETVFDGTNFTFANINLNDVVEVSGYLDSNNDLQATRIEKKGVLELGKTEIEVKGTFIQAISNTAFELMVNGNTLLINNPGGLTVPGGFSNGLRLEIKGIQTTQTEISATRIELDDENFNNTDSEVEIEGLITDYVSASSFRVNGQLVNATSATLVPANLILANNVKVEAEGTLVNGTLVAQKLEARSGRVEIRANVASAGGVNLTNKTVTMSVNGLDIILTTNNQTRLEDDLLGKEPFTLADINDGDFLSIKAYEDMGSYVATDIKRKEDAADIEVRIQGMVSAFDANTANITVLGINYSTDANTSFEINDIDTNSAQFYANLKTGDTIEIEDKKTNGNLDGIADKVEIK